MALLVYTGYEHLRGIRNDRNKVVVAIGSMIPDFLDKPIGSLIFNSGRWLGHNVFFQLTIFLILTGIWRNSNAFPTLGEDRKYLYLGATLHLVGDQPGLGVDTLFWPLFGSFPTGPENGFLLGFQSPFIILTEILGFGIMVTVGLYEKWPRTYWIIFISMTLIYLILYSIAYWVLVL